MRTVNLNAAYFPSVELLSAVATAAILLYGGNQVIDGAVTIGVLASFVFYLQTFFDPIQQLSQLYTTYQAGMAALDKIFELLDEEPDLARRRGRDRAAARARRDPVRGRGLRLRAGRAARAGGRDAGCAAGPDAWRWWAPPAPASPRSPSWWPASTTRPRADLDRRPRPALGHRAVAALAAGHRAAGGVPVLGHDPRQHRLRAPGRRRRRRWRQAARAVGAHDFIVRLPDGYDTEVGERGGHLSAGQRQLVAFARAAAADPRVLILDEATSNVDVHTEARIEHGLRRLLAGPHGDRDRPPPVDHPRRRADRGARGRPDRRAGHARRAAGGGRGLRAAVSRLGGAGGGLGAVAARPLRPRQDGGMRSKSRAAMLASG